jgi:hypothetical protein
VIGGVLFEHKNEDKVVYICGVHDANLMEKVDGLVKLSAGKRVSLQRRTMKMMI